MATAEKQMKIKTVKDLRNFIENIPDNLPVRGEFPDDRVEAVLWKADKGESGPRRYITFDDL
jgi:hypothetical protein